MISETKLLGNEYFVGNWKVIENKDLAGMILQLIM